MLRLGSILAAALVIAACGSDSGGGDDDDDISIDAAEGAADADVVVDEDMDGYPSDEDCDDNDAEIHPGADEVCDGVDNDCDELIDEDDAVDAPTWYRDMDMDGFGVDTDVLVKCDQPTGFVGVDGDCDDADDRFYPGAPETDCADPNDYNCDGSSGFADLDMDGFAACEECDDGDADVNPDATEVCDGIDNDCDTVIDEPDAADAPTWYPDTDGDDFGDPAGTPIVQCDQPLDHVDNSDDCDDTDEFVNPDATEVCDTIDNDCDTLIDEPDAADASDWYPDTDGDLFGDALAAPTRACFQPFGFVSDNTDCDDAVTAVNPAATEICDNVDNDCDTFVDGFSIECFTGASGCVDSDSDGIYECIGDCAAGNATCTAGSFGSCLGETTASAETCGGGDENCDGSTDEEGAVSCIDYRRDDDMDGWGVSTDIKCLCAPSAPYTVLDVGGTPTDCDDGNSFVNPGATEVCDGIDNNCVLGIDEEDASGCTVFYFDFDDDGYGVTADSKCLCAASDPYDTTTSGDCDDGAAGVNPGASEICNGIDDDCSGTADDDSIMNMCGTVANGTAACPGAGGCIIASCVAEFFDIDTTYSTGCECMAEPATALGTSCLSAIDLGNFLDSAGDTSSVTGKMAPAGRSIWYKFTAIDDTDTDGDEFHVDLRFLTNPDGAYRIEVIKGTCVDTPLTTSEIAVSWFTDQAGTPPGPGEGNCKSPEQVGFNTCDDQSDDFYFRVFRADGAGSCDQFDLQVSNGVF